MSKQDIYAEFFLEPVIMASTYVADNGRPLAEMTAAPSVQKGVAFEMRRCPYAGSREGKQMNVSALKELTLGFDECLNDTVYLRKKYFEYRGIERFSAGEFWRFNRAISGFPAFLVRRGIDAYDEKNFPTRLAVLFKAAQGLHLAAEVLILCGEGYGSATSSSGLYDLIESRNLFMDGDRACAGPPAMVEKFIESAYDGTHGDPDDAWVSTSLDCDIDELFRYSDAVTRLFSAKTLFEAENRLVSLELMAALGGSATTDSVQRVFSRFGVLVGRGETGLKRFQEGIAEFVQPPPQNNRAGDELKQEIASAIAALRSEISDQHIRICSAYIADNLMRTQEWLFLFHKLQHAILKHLNRPEDIPLLELSDIAGVGYMPLDIASAVSRVKFSYEDNAITLSVRRVGSKSVRYLE